MRGQATHQEQTRLFQPAGSPYNQQHQLHHQTQYQQLRRDLLTHERFRSDESESESTEFRPVMSSQSTEMSASANVETVVPPPPNHHKRSPFHINVPSDEQSTESGESAQGASSTNNQFMHNIEIPVHFYRLQPLSSGEGYGIA